MSKLNHLAALTAPQALYIEEVLGVSLDYFSGPATIAELLPVVVLTLPTVAAELSLLAKILGSLGRQDFDPIQVQLPAIEIGVVPPPWRARHVIAFKSGEPVARREFGDSCWWCLPALGEMLGTDNAVLEKKKATWALLQQFVKGIRV